MTNVQLSQCLTPHSDLETIHTLTIDLSQYLSKYIRGNINTLYSYMMTKRPGPPLYVEARRLTSDFSNTIANEDYGVRSPRTPGLSHDGTEVSWSNSSRSID